jgi:hypothetical protein
MIDISLGGLIGAIAGTVVAAVIYGTIIDFIEKQVRTTHASTAERSTVVREEIALLRHGVFAFAVLALGGVGYWIGAMIAD